MISRRDFIKWSAVAGAWVYVGGMTGCVDRVAQGPAGQPAAPRPDAPAPNPLDPRSIPQFATPLLIPPAMPKAKAPAGVSGVDYYEVSVRQFEQQILPKELPATTVWGYGPATAADKAAPMIHNAPSLTIEARAGVPTRVKWMNELVDDAGAFRPHLLTVDPTLHWANPAGGEANRDTRPRFGSTPAPYDGPVPLVTHVHGAVRVGDESDGYAEAWYLPKADNIPEGYATKGTWYDFFAQKAKDGFGAQWGDGYAVFQYPNENRASTLWYHDHTLGMTRLNVYAGPAGFFIVRGGDAGDDAVLDTRTGKPAVLPGPAPQDGDTADEKTAYYEIPIAIQDRAFNEDGSLFYPDKRDFFDGIVEPFIPEKGGFSPYWNPEFFGNTLIANGATWPFLEVEKRRYRFRFLNGCQSRFLILDFSKIKGAKVWQIGNEGGFLKAPVDLAEHENRLLMALAERADVIVDFTDVEPGDYVLGNIGPDEPFGGGKPGTDFEPADPDTTGRVLQFKVVAATASDESTPGHFLKLPKLPKQGKAAAVRKLALIEKMGMGHDSKGEEVEGPSEAVLGILGSDGRPAELEWASPVTETPEPGATEVWEIYNTTGDAHPMHVHETVFEVVDRKALATEGDDGELKMPLKPAGSSSGPEPWERGLKDTVIAYPGQVTRIKATFGQAGQYAWHCHIVEHEDNEMMRPYRIGAEQAGQPKPKPMNDTNDQPMPEDS